VLARNRIKYLRSLRIKKFRTQYRQFIAEGDKIVGDILKEKHVSIRQLIATGDWLNGTHINLTDRAEEIFESDIQDMERISFLETPSRVMAVMDIPDTTLDYSDLSGSWSLALDTIQDPGNLGTIIRTADWFGIRNILCNEECADCFNPKVVQASMGSLFRVKIHYTGLAETIGKLLENPVFPVYGTFTEGLPVFQLPLSGKGLVVFGNESRGISGELEPFIRTRITIPPGKTDETHVESLNVASAVAVVCSVIARN
jgi:RNA methyltransferase, TrmH family